LSTSRIGKAGPDHNEEIIVTFRREPDGTYTKIIKKMCRDWKTGGIKTVPADPVEEGPYELVSDPSCAEDKVAFEDFDGTMKYLYFQKVCQQE